MKTNICILYTIYTFSRIATRSVGFASSEFNPQLLSAAPAQSEYIVWHQTGGESEHAVLFIKKEPIKVGRENSRKTTREDEHMCILHSRPCGTKRHFLLSLRSTSRRGYRWPPWLEKLTRASGALKLLCGDYSSPRNPINPYRTN